MQQIHKAVILDRHSKVPLYKQLYLVIKDAIIAEEITDGEVFYSENQLMEMYNVSRITVRSTMRLLEDEGFIKKSQGSASIVLNRSKLWWNLLDISQDLQKKKDDLTSKIISIKKVKPDSQICNALRIDDNTDFVYRIERVRMIKDIKVTRSISFLVPWLNVDVTKIVFTEKTSISEVLERFGQKPSHCDETIEAVVADALTCEYLGLPSSSAVFYRERITYNKQDQPIEFVKSYYNSKYTKYYINNRIL